MKLHICTLVWNDSYIDLFIKYALPALMSQRNLHALSKYIDTEFHVITRKEDLKRLRSEPLLDYVGKHVIPLTIQAVENINFTLPACAVQHWIKGPIVASIGHMQDAILFISPDTVWSDGYLEYFGQALKAGKSAIYTSSFRVTTETVIHDLPKGGLPNHYVPRLLLKHMHPIVGASVYNGQQCVVHPEYLVWPVQNEGINIYHLVRDLGCHLPHRLVWTDKDLLAESNDTSLFDVNPYLGLSCTPITAMLNWLHTAKPHSVKRHAMFMANYPQTFYSLFDPIRLSLMLHPSHGKWAQAEHDARAYFHAVRDFRHSILNGSIPFQRQEQLAQSYGSSLDANDVDICIKALEWVPYVIDGRFRQATLDLLKRVDNDRNRSHRRTQGLRPTG